MSGPIGSARVVPFVIGNGPELWDGHWLWRIEDDNGVIALVRPDNSETGWRETADSVVAALNNRLPSPDDAAAVEFLSEHMHQAWMRQSVANGAPDHPYTPDETADRAVEGFPAGVGIPCRYCDRLMTRHHQSMIPYADLSEPVKELDRAGAREFLRAVREYMSR